MSARWRSLPQRLRPGGPDFGRWVTPEELNVAPALLGRPLARPTRRLLAIGVDLAAIGLVSSWSNFWLLAAVSLGVFAQVRAARWAAAPWRKWLAWALVALMAYAGAQDVIDTLRDAGTPAKVRAEESEDEADEVFRDSLQAVQAAASAPLVVADSPASAATAATAASAAASAAESIARLKQQVRRLQGQLAKERDAAEEAAAAENWRERLRRFGLDFGVSYGWSLVYFTMLPVWWRGQTLGKRMFSLRIVEITGKAMTPLLSFKRFGGYLAGLATGGLGLVQLLWDPNRQALQDKAAHTVVIDERLPRRPEPVDSAPQSAAVALAAPTMDDPAAAPAELPAPEPLP